MIKKILIANRGEIACRIIRTCKEMGIMTVAVYSTADKHSLHTKLANEAICIGGPLAKDSYLNMNNIIQAACLTGCDAIHPGFGFLSENSTFAAMVEKCKLIFIGPNPETIRKMGNKDEARRLMEMAKIPLIPGTIEAIKDLSEGKKIAKKLGYPVILKAVHGGGGRGMRVCPNEKSFENCYLEAKAEALSCFLNDEIYLEKYFGTTKHIEVQIAGDKYGNVLHLFERDCSFQRRNQKLIEEAPSTIAADVRKKIIKDAVRAAKFVHYDSLGTIEFLVDENNNHYFMEMNTRIQVEHPVTEAITGLDLIKLQIKIASGQKILLKQTDIVSKGYAIECRINAEDIKENFKPSGGQIKFLHLPVGANIRIESGIYQGDTISPFYDSMLMKLIAYGKTRLEAIKTMRRALEELLIDGIANNVEFLYLVMHQKGFIEGKYKTNYAQTLIKELKDGKYI